MSLENRILDKLRENGGDVTDPDDVLATLGIELGVRQMAEVIAAVQNLEQAGLAERPAHNRRKLALTEAGFAGDYVNGSAAAPGSDGTPPAKAADGQEPHSTAQPLAGPGNAAKKRTTVEDRVVAAVARKYSGHMTSEEGACVGLLAVELDVSPSAIQTALTRLVNAKRITKTARRGKGGGTTSIVVLAGAEGANDGQLQELSGADRVGTNGHRKGRPARRKARAPARAKATQRRPGGRRRTARATSPGGRGRRDGGPQGVDQPLHDVPERQPAPQESSIVAELTALRTIVDAFDGLTPLGQQYIASTLCEKVLGRP